VAQAERAAHMIETHTHTHLMFLVTGKMQQGFNSVMGCDYQQQPENRALFRNAAHPTKKQSAREQSQ
jgi:hypothetical protein